MHVEVLQIPACPIACSHHIGQYEGINEAFDRLVAWMELRDIFAQNPQYLGIYWDDPNEVPINKLRSDACCTLRQPIVAEGEIRPGAIPAGTYAVAHHQGPYPTLNDAWDWMFNTWLPSTDLQLLDGISFELYLNDAAEVTPDQLLTDLYLPVVGGPARTYNPWGQPNLPF